MAGCTTGTWDEKEGFINEYNMGPFQKMKLWVVFKSLKNPDGYPSFTLCRDTVC